MQVTLGEARSRLKELVERAEKGEEIVIAGPGSSGVRLVRAEAASVERRSLLERARALRQCIEPLQRGEVRDWLDEGRRH